MVTRREFIGSLTLLGVSRKSGRSITGSFVNESHALGHRLRDGVPFAAPSETSRVGIAIVGGGIAGLSAAWRLQKHGVQDFVVLEMEGQAGGNARWGENAVSAYPWAAHYVPVPGPRATLVRELFADLGVLETAGEPETRAGGRGIGEWRERDLCHAPQERLFIHGRWQEGLEPVVGPTARDRDQMRRFDDRMAEYRASGAFAVPMADADARGSAPAGALPPAPARIRSGAAALDALDRLSMEAWLRQEGFDSPWLHWLVEYGCRDDYGARARDVSAWAGIHYYAAREQDDPGPLTWPEGNGWIVRRLLERLGGHVRTGTIAYRLERAGRRWRILTPGRAWLADAVIVAAPAFVAARLIADGPPADRFEYSPWLTANLTLDRWPGERGIPPAWDNVIFESPALGYVVATHQSMRQYIPRTVWTYYWALTDGPPARVRRWLLAQTYESLRDRILRDLARAHPDIADCVAHVDIMRHGHAMIRPTVGFRTDPDRLRLQGRRDRLFFAHSDVSGISIFEEAQYRGVMAADAARRAAG
jgi:phytoene dehydrogenase-like protein